VPLPVEARAGVWLFQGSEDRDRLAGGVYHYAGSPTPTNIHSPYRSDYDHGIFEMSRP